MLYTELTLSVTESQHSHLANDVLFRAGCSNAQLTARLGNGELTVIVQLSCVRVARSMVSKG